MTRGLERWIDGPQAGEAPPEATKTAAGPDAVERPGEPQADMADHELWSEIGRGGMGTVLRAFDRRLQRVLALKVLDARWGDRERRRDRFIDEARLTGQLEHPGVVPVHELGCESGEGRWYFSMKLVEGVTLDELLRRAGPERLEPDTLADLLQVFIKVCEAVSFAHSRGIVHRDLKPSNIMIGHFGQVYVMDWGVARPLSHRTGDEDRSWLVMTVDKDGDVIGTPAYMAPEQARSEHDRVDERTDVFNLGATLYHLLTGAPPYSGGSALVVLMQANKARVRPPEQVDPRVPPALSRITMRAMAAERADRFPSVVELQQAVADFLRGGWHLPTEDFADGALIVAEGDPADAAYIIQSGRCEVLKQAPDGSQQVLRVMESGEVFGETAILTHAPRTASVRALGPVRLMVVREATLTEALGLNAWMGRFVTALAARFREVDARVGALEHEVHRLRRRLQEAGVDPGG